jgi:hypothetical protein
VKLAYFGFLSDIVFEEGDALPVERDGDQKKYIGKMNDCWVVQGPLEDLLRVGI